MLRSRRKRKNKPIRLPAVALLWALTLILAGGPGTASFAQETAPPPPPAEEAKPAEPPEFPVIEVTDIFGPIKENDADGMTPVTPILAPDISPEVAAALEEFLRQGFNLGFSYQREGRADPFFPFLAQEMLQAATTERDELTGMRRFEPGQLTLVAIVQGGRQPLAMVQDAAGVGYIIRPGTPIGRTGEVTAIAADRVIIRQEAFSLTKEKEYRTVEMVLPKEGEKK